MSEAPVVVLPLPTLARRGPLAEAVRELWPLLWRPDAVFVLQGGADDIRGFTQALAARYPLPRVQRLQLRQWAPGAPGRVLEGVDAAELSAWLERDHPRQLPGGRDSPAWARARPRLSVVVPTHRRFGALQRLLTALEDQEGAPPFEVLIVDDGSPEGPAAWPDLTTTPLAVRMLRQPNSGPAVARNLALQHARGALAVLLNDDAVPPPDLLRGHEEQWAEGGQNSVVMGVFTLTPEHRRDSFAELVETTKLLFPQPVLPGPGPFPGVLLCTGNCSMPTVWLRQVGGFDRWFRTAGGEDSELGRRMHLVDGREVRFVPSLRCGHDHALSVSGFVRRQEHLGRCSVYLARRWGDPRVVTGDPRVPIAGAFLAAQRRRLRGGERALLTEPAQLDARCAEERREGRLKGELAQFSATVRRLGALAFARGVVAEWGTA